MKYDIAIIGSGMSGLMASIYLADQGFKTAVITKGDPICSISSGSIDIAGTGSDTFETIDNLPPLHPYKTVGNDGIKVSIEYFLNLMKEKRSIYAGSIEKNRSVLTPIGKHRITSLVPFTMEHADIKKDENFHIVSFTNLKDFFPSYIKSNYPNLNISIFDAGTHTTMGIAAKMDTDNFLSLFISWINKQKIKEKKIGLPAVLGIRKTSKIFTKLENETGKLFFEIPTLPPSIPGLRLYRNLKNIAENKGVYFYGSAQISDFKKNKDSIINITIKKPGRPDYVDAEAFILATGSFVSGGLFLDKTIFKETVFNLPVFAPNTEDLFNSDFFKLGHPIEKSGVLIDANFQALNGGYKNLFIAGSILAHSETMKYQCGHGMAISTGFAAANYAQKFLKGVL